MKDIDILKKIARELAAHNKLMALQIARHNVITTFDKTDEQILQGMKDASQSILDWCYGSPDADFPLEVNRSQPWTI